MLSSTQLLVNPIMGLLPKFSENEFEEYVSWKKRKADSTICNDYKPLIISFSDLLYKIDLDDKDKKLLLKALRKNKKMLGTLNTKKKNLSIDIINTVDEALLFSYELEHR